MTEPEARREAAAILKDEANELAMMADKFPELPHRGKVAIQREIQRFRELAEALNPTK